MKERTILEACNANQLLNFYLMDARRSRIPIGVIQDIRPILGSALDARLSFLGRTDVEEEEGSADQLLKNGASVLLGVTSETTEEAIFALEHAFVIAASKGILAEETNLQSAETEFARGGSFVSAAKMVFSRQIVDIMTQEALGACMAVQISVESARAEDQSINVEEISGQMELHFSLPHPKIKL